MNSGYVAAAFVRLLELREQQIKSHQNEARARLVTIDYELAHCAAQLRAIQEAIAEAKLLLYAVTEGQEWFIQPDGTVKTERPASKFSAPIQEGLL